MQPHAYRYTQWNHLQPKLIHLHWWDIQLAHQKSKPNKLTSYQNHEGDQLNHWPEPWLDPEPNQQVWWMWLEHRHIKEAIVTWPQTWGTPQIETQITCSQLESPTEVTPESRESPHKLKIEETANSAPSYRAFKWSNYRYSIELAQVEFFQKFSVLISTVRWCAEIGMQQ